MGDILYNRGAITLNFVISFVLALPIGLLLLARFRKAIERLMQETTGMPPSDHGARRTPGVSLKLRVQRTEALGHPLRLPSGSLAHAAFVELAAGLAFGLVAALLVLLFAGFEILPVRLIAVTATFAWPSVLVLNLMWGPDRSRQAATVAAFGAVIVLICLISGLSSSHRGAQAFLAPLMLWAIYGWLGLLVLIFLNRSIRAIGPVLVLMAASALFGANLALSLLTTDSGIAAAIDLADTIGGGAQTAFFGTAFVGLLAGLSVGWIGAGVLANGYATKRFSEQMLVSDTIWLVQTLILANSLVIEAGGWGLLAALMAFTAYKLTAIFGYRHLRARVEGQVAEPLLFLRVFGFRPRSSRLVDLIAARWRSFGPVWLIAAPDVAARVLAPRTFLKFLRGTLGALFVHQRADLSGRLSTLDRTRDPDGRFRIEEVFCAGEIWREAVSELMRDARAVVMDLRTFGRANAGCIYELQGLLDSVPLERALVLVDATTELAFLRETLGASWRSLSASSPNLPASQPRLVLLDVTASESVAVDMIETMLGTVSVGHREPNLWQAAGAGEGVPES
jgi:hypothetical protein